MARHPAIGMHPASGDMDPEAFITCCEQQVVICIYFKDRYFCVGCRLLPLSRPVETFAPFIFIFLHFCHSLPQTDPLMRNSVYDRGPHSLSGHRRNRFRADECQGAPAEMPEANVCERITRCTGIPTHQHPCKSTGYCQAQGHYSTVKESAKFSHTIVLGDNISFAGNFRKAIAPDISLGIGVDVGEVR
jgi:hypothetical protein